MLTYNKQNQSTVTINLFQEWKVTTNEPQTKHKKHTNQLKHYPWVGILELSLY